MKSVLLTGFRPTGNLHLGHFISLIEPILRYKDQHQIFIMIADLHAHTELRKPMVDYLHFSDDLAISAHMALQIITNFVDPKDIVVFRQSDLKEYHLDLFYKLLMVSRHNLTFGNPVFVDSMETELHREIDLLKLDPFVRQWIKIFIDNNPEVLWGNISESMTKKLKAHFFGAPTDWSKYKVTVELIEKTVKHLNTRIGVMGFATYPILMAADIILYQPEYTLVGKDQNPHIQITNDLVKIMNKTFGFDLQPTKAMICSESTLKGNDGLKMSKTAGNYIPLKQLLRNDNLALEWFTKMKSYPRRLDEAGNPRECLVAEYWNTFGSSSIQDMCATGKLGCLECKNNLYQLVKSRIRSLLRENRIYEDTEKMLKEGAEVARQRLMDGELARSYFIN